MAGCSTSSKSSPDKDALSLRSAEKSTVSIVADTGEGGSGVIIQSSPKQTIVLTNEHVCKSIHSGGFVHADSGISSRIVSIKPSKKHDLCLVRVYRYLGPAAPVAQSEPSRGDFASVIGHPNLLPQIRADGHFTDYMVIRMMTGIRPCTEEKATSVDGGFVCAFLGGFPIYELFETQVVSSIVAPGNSGSPVFDRYGRVTTLVFVGNGRGLSHALTVPNGYINNFLKRESKRLKWSHPSKFKPKKKEGLFNALTDDRKITIIRKIR